MPWLTCGPPAGCATELLISALKEALCDAWGWDSTVWEEPCARAYPRPLFVSVEPFLNPASRVWSVTVITMYPFHQAGGGGFAADTLKSIDKYGMNDRATLESASVLRSQVPEFPPTISYLKHGEFSFDVVARPVYEFCRLLTKGHLGCVHIAFARSLVRFLIRLFLVCSFTLMLSCRSQDPFHTRLSFGQRLLSGYRPRVAFLRLARSRLVPRAWRIVYGF
jgi:hypothetical protein